MKQNKVTNQTTTTIEHSPDRVGVSNPQPAMNSELLDVRAVAALLGNCSTRHVRRLTDVGKMPRPIKLGSLLRWRRAELEAWIAAGCPTVQAGGRNGG